MISLIYYLKSLMLFFQQLDKFRTWWYSENHIEPLDEEGPSSDELNQQCKMLCALRDPEETAPLIVAHDNLKIIEDHILETNPPINPPSNNEENNSASATTSSLFPPSPRLKTTALDGYTRSNTLIQYDTPHVRKP